MRILIIRSGSGWGGYIGEYLIDTSNKVIIDIYKCFNILKVQAYYGSEKIIRLPLDFFPESCIKEFNYDISDLEASLPTAEIETEEVYMFDQQTDEVYFLAEDDTIRCILDTSGNGHNVYLKDDQLFQNLNKLLGVVSNDRF